MVITMLEAEVAEARVEALTAAFDAAGEELPDAILESYLAQAADGDTWCLVTVWRSREALGRYRESVDTPEGIRMFRSVGVEPRLRIMDVERRAGP